MAPSMLAQGDAVLAQLPASLPPGATYQALTFRSEKRAGVGTPPTVAATEYGPPSPLAVYAGDVAKPSAFVATTVAVPALANVPLGPAGGAVKVTPAAPTGV